MYVRCGMTDAEIRSLGLTRVVPVRRYSGGRAPGFKTNEAGHKESEMRRNVETTAEERRKLMAAVLEISVKTLWSNSLYQFGGRYFQQLSGGPTGSRATMCASRIVMYHWSRKLIRIIETSGLKTWMKSAYCDDVRLIISLFTSLKWDPDTKAFVSCEPVMDGSDIDALTVRGAEKMHGLNYP